MSDWHFCYSVCYAYLNAEALTTENAKDYLHLEFNPPTAKWKQDRADM